jgi:hypothetical protein
MRLCSSKRLVVDFCTIYVVLMAPPHGAGLLMRQERSSKRLVVDFGFWYCICYCGGANTWRRRITDDYNIVWFFQKVCFRFLVLSCAIVVFVIFVIFIVFFCLVLILLLQLLTLLFLLLLPLPTSLLIVL